MASYYDEHDCQPLREGEQPNHMLHLARLLIDTGLASDWGMQYSHIFGGEKPAPPAAKAVVAELPVKRITEREQACGMQCPVCLLPYNDGDEARQLPCRHSFHTDCILPWLHKTNSCPVCRHELPTDDEDYETFKRQKARATQRTHDIESLHSSMFG